MSKQVEAKKCWIQKNLGKKIGIKNLSPKNVVKKIKVKKTI